MTNISKEAWLKTEHREGGGGSSNVFAVFAVLRPDGISRTRGSGPGFDSYVHTIRACADLRNYVTGDNARARIKTDTARNLSERAGSHYAELL